MKRKHYVVADGRRYYTRAHDEAHLVSSEVIGSDLHMPVLDIDVPHRYVPSATEGHAHLYIDVPVSWRRYKKLLKTLAIAGVIELGYARASIARGATFVRTPWAPKGQGPALDHTYVIDGWHTTEVF